MGKGSENKTDLIKDNQSNDKCELKKLLYTRDEVKRHNTKNDLWIIINENVYDMTNFQRTHPGGSKILNIYSGQDASEVFNAFHKEFDRVNKYSKLYHIGKIQPEETKLTTMSVSELKVVQDFQKEKELREDFEKLRRVAFEKGFFNPSFTFFVLNALHILFFHITGYYILWNYGASSFLAVLFAIIFHTISQAQSDWAQHDFGHSAFLNKPKYNRYLQMLYLGLIKGASADWWNYMHNQHHAKPNVLNIDPDVRLSPYFVLGEIDPKRKAIKNAKKEEKFYYPYSVQHYYFPFAAPLLFPIYFQIQTFRYAIRKKLYLDLVTMCGMFLIHFGITITVFRGIVKPILYLFVVRCIESTWFAWVSQSNHIVMDIHDDDDRDSWLSLQLRATCNLEKSWFNDWFTGHLNFQIEHHLFPTMPRHNLYKVQPLVMSLCKKHNIQYIIKPMGKAFIDILLSLKKSGQLWLETYNEFLASY